MNRRSLFSLLAGLVALPFGAAARGRTGGVLNLGPYEVTYGPDGKAAYRAIPTRSIGIRPNNFGISNQWCRYQSRQPMAGVLYDPNVYYTVADRA